MEPCMVADVDNMAALGPCSYWGVSSLLWALGIESLFGPDWPSQRRTLCWFTGWWSDYCDMLYDIDIHHPTWNWEGTQEISVKVGQHLL